MGRGRDGESDYSEEYIEQLHKYHEMIFNPKSHVPKPGEFIREGNVYIINGNTKKDNVRDAAVKVYDDINS